MSWFGGFFRKFCTGCWYYNDKRATESSCTKPEFCERTDTPIAVYTLKYGNPLELNKDNKCDGYRALPRGI